MADGTLSPNSRELEDGEVIDVWLLKVPSIVADAVLDT
jgi:hypothetical protein